MFIVPRQVASGFALAAVLALAAGCGQPTTPKAETNMQNESTAAKAALPKGRILGIGGIFFKSADPKGTGKWYADHLGLKNDGSGVMLPWRSADDPSQEHLTVWSLFPADTNYFAPSTAPFMINYIVDDMDAFLAKVEKEGVKIDPKRQDESYGRFAWIYDPEGNKIELWQPLTPPAE